MTAYSAEVLDRVREPRRAGALPPDDPQVGTGEAGSLDSGTLVRITIRADAGTQQIDAARFKVFGCSAAIASASVIAERLEDASLAEAESLAAGDIVAELDLPAERVHVAALAVEAARRAIADWKRRATERR